MKAWKSFSEWQVQDVNMGESRVWDCVLPKLSIHLKCPLGIQA